MLKRLALLCLLPFAALGAPAVPIFSQARLGNGTAAAPAGSFTSDTDTGYYRSAANVFSISAGGTLTASFALGQLTLRRTTATNSLVSDTSAATATSAIAAITLAPSATLDANDLVLELNSAAGTSLLSVDLEGDAILAGDLSLAGNDLGGTGTGATFRLTSATNDATTSTTVAAVTLQSLVNLTDGDLVLNVENSAGDNLLTVSEQGALTALTDVNAAGNDYNCTGVGATCGITSSTNDATTSGTVAAITLTAGVNVTAGDLVLAVRDSAAAALLTVDEEGDAVVTGRVSSVANVAMLDSGDANPATGVLNPATNLITFDCQDANGCTVTMGETGAVNGTLVTIVNTSANAANFADTAGVSETTGAIALGQYDSLQLVYAVDRWVMVATSNN